MKLIYTEEDRLLLKQYKCATKAKYSNRRFVDQIHKSDVLNCLKRFNFRCVFCDDKLKSSWHLDHFHPKANGGKNVIENICPTCKWCNIMKNALDGWSFIVKCAKVYSKNQISNHENVPVHFKKAIQNLNLTNNG